MRERERGREREGEKGSLRPPTGSRPPGDNLPSTQKELATWKGNRAYWHREKQQKERQIAVAAALLLPGFGIIVARTRCVPFGYMWTLRRRMACNKRVLWMRAQGGYVETLSLQMMWVGCKILSESMCSILISSVLSSINIHWPQMHVVIVFIIYFINLIS